MPSATARRWPRAWSSPAACPKRLAFAARKRPRACGLPDEPPYPPASLVDTLLLDKKRSGDGITFVFCERPGRCLLRRMPFDELRALTARTFGA